MWIKTPTSQQCIVCLRPYFMCVFCVSMGGGCSMYERGQHLLEMCLLLGVFILWQTYSMCWCVFSSAIAWSLPGILSGAVVWPLVEAPRPSPLLSFLDLPLIYFQTLFFCLFLPQFPLLVSPNFSPSLPHTHLHLTFPQSFRLWFLHLPILANPGHSSQTTRNDWGFPSSFLPNLTFTWKM